MFVQVKRGVCNLSKTSSRPSAAGEPPSARNRAVSFQRAGTKHGSELLSFWGFSVFEQFTCVYPCRTGKNANLFTFMPSMCSVHPLIK